MHSPIRSCGSFSIWACEVQPRSAIRESVAHRNIFTAVKFLALYLMNRKGVGLGLLIRRKEVQHSELTVVAAANRQDGEDQSARGTKSDICKC